MNIQVIKWYPPIEIKIACYYPENCKSILILMNNSYYRFFYSIPSASWLLKKDIHGEYWFVSHYYNHLPELSKNDMYLLMKTLNTSL